MAWHLETKAILSSWCPTARELASQMLHAGLTDVPTHLRNQVQRTQLMYLHVVCEYIHRDSTYTVYIRDGVQIGSASNPGHPNTRIL